MKGLSGSTAGSLDILAAFTDVAAADIVARGAEVGPPEDVASAAAELGDESSLTGGAAGEAEAIMVAGIVLFV